MLRCGRALIIQEGELSSSHPSFGESHEDRPAKENGTWGFPRQEISKVKRLTNYFGIQGVGRESD